MTGPTRKWTDIAPADAVDVNLADDLSITAPLNENGERCPWPWEPQQLINAPIGQYRCPYCFAMCVAGIPHIDYAPEGRALTAENFDEVAEWCGGKPAVSDRHRLVIEDMGEVGEARIGDTIHRDGYGMFTIRPAASPTPCGPVPDRCDAESGEPCADHEREQAHADGEHELCEHDEAAQR